MKIVLLVVGLSFLVGCGALSKKKPEKSRERPLFYVFGDIPYDNVWDGKEWKFIQNDLLPKIHRNKPDFLFHVGNVKPGSVPCNQQFLRRRLVALSQLYPGYFLYTPGDNDWTDCDQMGGGSELRQLQSLRESLKSIPVNSSFRQKTQWVRQTELPENQAWNYLGVQFLSLHTVGTNQGFSKILEDNKSEAFRASLLRDKLNRNWAKASMSRNSSQAWVVFTHADVLSRVKRTRYGKKTCNMAAEDCNGFLSIFETLVGLAQNVDGPVLLVHGDTDPFCLKTPIETGVANLWALNSPGDFHELDLASVEVRPDDRTTPFLVRSVLTGSPISLCQP